MLIEFFFKEEWRLGVNTDLFIFGLWVTVFFMSHEAH